MNTTQISLLNIEPIENYYIPCSLSAVFAFIAVILCLLILILVWRTKQRLHTVNHLLICNTCVASIFYCTVININYLFLIFIPTETSDISCRFRAYFAYASITAVIYSYFIQAISRLFFSILSSKCRWLITFQAHYLLILIQWSIVFLLTLPAIITNDIHFFPNALCWVGLNALAHVFYTFIVYYLIPVMSIILIYIYIYYRVHQTRRNLTVHLRSTRREKLDLELLRNILILLSVYLLGGLPLIIFIVTSIRVIYMINLVTISLVVALEKLLTIILDREIRQVIERRFVRNDIKPMNTS